MNIRILSLVFALCAISASAQNLLLNPGFETASSNFLGTSFEDWEGTPSYQSVETTDILSGTQAAHITASRSGSLYQELALDTAAVGQPYELTVHYKLLSTSGTFSLNTYWESNSEGALAHDEDSIYVTLPAGTGWQTYTTHTTRPVKGNKLHFSVGYSKGVEVLLDDFSLVAIPMPVDTTVTPEPQDTTTVDPEPTGAPTIVLNPTSLSEFYCEYGETVYDTVRVSASGCTDYVWITLTNDQTPGAFTINNSMMPKNVQGGICVVSFHPLTPGNYSATLQFATAGGETQTILLTGLAADRESPAVLPYDTQFHFTNIGALPYLAEHFDSAQHNEQLVLTGWQNVVVAGSRPWWTLDQLNDEDFHCAKATAFESGRQDTTEWDMWLVTPPLDYPNAAGKQFTFRVRGDYLFDDMPTALELFYIDATDTTDVYRQLIEAAIPKTKDEKGTWYDIVVDLTGQTTIADVFYMAFRYTGPSGIAGAPTYYIDDIIWGEAPSALPSNEHEVLSTKYIINGQLVIQRGDRRYNAQGIRL